MASLLKELLHDAERRGTEIAAGLQDLSGHVPAEVESYRTKMLQLVQNAKKLVASMLSDPDLELPIYATSYFRDYKYVARLMQELENIPLLVLRRFSTPDLRITSLVAAMCKEVNFPFAAPICSSVSSQFYWTMPDMDVVFVPCLEPEHLLGLPDMYHELGHIALFREQPRLVQPALTIVDKCYDQIVANGKKQNWPSASLDEVERFRDAWRQSWLLEFASDLIATFLVGPAFGWCNIRTSTNLGGELFSGSDSHPADDARAKAIAQMLEQICCKTEAREITSRWDELVVLSKESTPHRYDVAYPPRLLTELATFFDAQCDSMGLTRFELTSTSSVSSAVNEAWNEFRQNPNTFHTYEQQRLATLLSEIGAPSTT